MAFNNPAESSRNSEDCNVECVEDWDVPEYHADPYNCSSFYRCSNGVPYLYPCPADLIFNPNLNICDFPESYACEVQCFDNGEETTTTSNSPTEPSTTTELPTTTEPPTTTESSATTEPPTTTELPTTITLPPTSSTENPKNSSLCSVGCRVKKKYQTHANPYDCDSYYSCRNGFPQLVVCQRKWTYNSTVGDCTYKNDDHECTPKADDEECTPEPKCCDPPTCVEPSDVEEYYIDPSDCGSFYGCINRVAVKHSCPMNLIFNPNVNRCEYPNYGDDDRNYYRCEISCFLCHLDTNKL